MGAMLMSRYFDYGTLSLTDRAGAMVALAGVVLVVQPDIIFRSTSAPAGMASRSSHETPKPLKGVVCGLVGVAGGVVSVHTPTITKLVHLFTIITETDEFLRWLDRPGDYSSDWASGTSSDKRKLLCLGSCTCHYDPEFCSAFDLADELAGLGVIRRRRDSRHSYGGFPSISRWLGRREIDNR